MSNILDYLRWRGDLTFDQASFNEVDNYILCKIGTPDYAGILPESGRPVLLPRAAERYFALHPQGDASLGVMTSDAILPMLRVLGKTKRFEELTLSEYVNRFSPDREEQFSALTVGLPDGTHFVTFRGTDDTLVAWKENFNMVAEDAVPAQVEAAAYLVSAAQRWPGRLMVGGHSKGGNLAVYAAMHAPEPIQDRIAAVYNNDGPGFRRSVVDSPAYGRIRPRLITLVSQYALVGVLMYHEEEYEIVKSRRGGVAAHDGFNWEVLRDHFVRCGSLTARSRIFEEAMASFASDFTPEQQRETIDTLFDVLGATGAETLTEVNEHKLRQAMEIVQDMRQDAKARAVLLNMIELLLKEYVASARRVLPNPKQLLKRQLRRFMGGDEPKTRG